MRTSLTELTEWPSVPTTEDYYWPPNAAPLLRALKGLDDDSARISIRLWAMNAVDALVGLVLNI